MTRTIKNNNTKFYVDDENKLVSKQIFDNSDIAHLLIDNLG